MTGHDMAPTGNETEQSMAPFADKARVLVAESANQEPLEQFAAATAFLESIDTAASSGEIIGSDGTVYTKELMDKQLTLLYNESKQLRELKSPLQAVPRSGGLRDAIGTLYRDENMAPALFEALHRREYEKKRVKDGLAETALRSNVAQNPTEMVQAQVENESIDTQEAAIETQLKELNSKHGDSMELWRYASGKMNQREYQQDGDAASAKGEEQKAGQALMELRKMGPDAVADAEKYLQLMRQLKSLRSRRQ